MRLAEGNRRFRRRCSTRCAGRRATPCACSATSRPWSATGSSCGCRRTGARTARAAPPSRRGSGANAPSLVGLQSLLGLSRRRQPRRRGAHPGGNREAAGGDRRPRVAARQMGRGRSGDAQGRARSASRRSSGSRPTEGVPFAKAMRMLAGADIGAARRAGATATWGHVNAGPGLPRRSRPAAARRRLHPLIRAPRSRRACGPTRTIGVALAVGS